MFEVCGIKDSLEIGSCKMTLLDPVRLSWNRLHMDSEIVVDFLGFCFLVAYLYD